MVTSHRHHYLPQFFLKNFTYDGRNIFIYNKATGRITNSHIRNSFFSWDRNTSKVSDIETSLIEDFYAKYDNEYSSIISEATDGRILNDKLVASLIVFASIHKWRTPFNDDLFTSLKESLSMQNLGFYLAKKDGTRETSSEVNDLFMSIPLVKDLKRILIPMLSITNTDKFSDLISGSLVERFIPIPESKPCPNLIGDCLVLERNHTPYNSLDDFVMPLSSYFTLACKRGSTREVINVSRLKIGQDLATLHRSKKYVGCSNKQYLEEMVAHYKVIKVKLNDDELLDEYIMRTIFESIV